MLRKFMRRRRDEGAVAAVIDNLNHILNTHKGFGSYLKEMGIGDYNAYKSRARIIETIVREIRENITRFEPRVRLDKIEPVDSDSPFRLRFQVKCGIVDSTKPIYIVLDSVYNRVYLED